MRRRAARAALLGAALLHACARIAHASAYNFSIAAFANNTASLVYAGAAAFYDARLDACGVCGGNNATCTGCDGVPNSGAVLDGCGLCTRNCTQSAADPTCLFQPVCPDCAGVVGGTKDTLGACGGCREPSDPLYGTAGVPNWAVGGCVGCDGVANSGAVPDACGVCRAPGDARANATCAGCDGVPNSGAVYDACCVCGGNATLNSDCYRTLLANPPAAGVTIAAPFNPSTDTYATFFSALGRARVDACGECAGWGYGGAECGGCDGVPMSGALPDPCGVCGGGCACTAGADATAGACGPDLAPCALAQTAGPGANGTPLYPATPQNRAGLPAWVDAITVACMPPAANGTNSSVVDAGGAAAEWVVLLYGREVGPFTLAQLRSGAVDVFDTASNATVSVALTPLTLVGRVVTTLVARNITYGYTSALPARAAAWAAAAAGRPGVVAAPTAVSTPNIVQLLVNETTLLDFGGAATPTYFQPVGAVPALVGVAYPACTAVSFRNGTQRTHGKRTGLNHLGLIVSANITDAFSGLANQSWNPWAEFIYDVADAWEDQTCVCHPEWTYSTETPDAVPPTCPRAWGRFDAWIADTHATPAAPGAPFTLTAARSVAGGTLLPSGGGGGDGGFYVADAGGLGVALYSPTGEDPSGHDAARGPWRVTPFGTLTFTSVGPLPGVALRCAPSARLAPPAPGGAGALWYAAQRVPFGGGLDAALRFVLSSPAQRCADVRALRRGFSEEIRTRAYLSCAAQPGDGFALVLQDAPGVPTAGTLGAGGGGLGYEGLPYSAAVEFDARGDPARGEPATPHVAVLSRGALPNSASHRYCVGATTDMPPFADGGEHVARVTYTPRVQAPDLFAALDDPSWRGTGANLATLLAGGAPVGLLRVYLDDLSTPVLTVPFSLDVITHANTSSAYVGLTAANGAFWHAVDILSWNVSGAS